MMKKLLLFFAVTILTAGLLSAQEELSLSWEGESLGDTVMVVGDPGEFEILFEALVTNNTDTDMKLMVFRKRLELLDGASSAFCWGLCYSPDVDTSLDNHTIKAGESSVPGEFSGHYYPNNVIGTSVVEYTFYNMDNPDIRVSIVCKYKASPEGIAEEAMRGGFVSEVYPNPAVNQVSIDYQLTPQVNQARVMVYNVLGSLVREVALDRGNGKMSLDVSGLDKGVYFYSILVNGDVYQTKKLIIQ